MSEREPIPPTTCDYIIRMNLKTIEAVSRYMAGGCRGGALNGPQMVCVSLIELRNHINDILERHSK